jgi:hypothetical protein
MGLDIISIWLADAVIVALAYMLGHIHSHAMYSSNECPRYFQRHRRLQHEPKT